VLALTSVQPAGPSFVADDSTYSDVAGARDDEMTSLPTIYVEHMQHIVSAYDRWNDAACLFDDSSGRM